MAAARFCISRLRAGAGPALSRFGEKSLRTAGRSQRGWTGGAFTAGFAIAAAHSGVRAAAAAPASADSLVTSDQKSGIPQDNVHVGGHKPGDWFKVPELSLRDHYFIVPLDHDKPNGSSITVFAREVVGVGKEDKLLPYLLFLQGGPGFECARPTEAGGWVKKACEEYRVVLLDQRGTGLSSPLTTTSLAQFESPKQQAAFLRNFRADSIVKDAEIVRSYLIPGGEPWSVLGQSYGGFCAVTYLSMAPHGLHHVLLTGGLPPIDDGCTAETVYRACYKRVAIQNAKFYKRFPGDAEVVRSVVLHLAQCEGGGVPLPSGGFLTPRGLQLLGLSGLGSSGGLERLHYLFERAWDPILVPGAKKSLSYNFLRAVDDWFDFDTNPLYAIMHESIYCQGAASNWAAHRVREELGDQFDAVKAASNSTQVLFTGEMVFPWMFDELAALRPLKEAANIIAEASDWPPLYNKKQLNENKVPVAAAVYYEDLYVNVTLSEETAAQIQDIRLWVTNEYLHSGIREDGPRILDQLFGMLKGKYPIR
ncbi:uncharacterized protein [Physcomitrium patens]|uniref:AB hydrolase-1 domain-containing protein n=1 Tax=Physcomitrium patens TaxID=3218 RepID=A9TIX9_PHYPA|nr:uncharacterized protein LOC112273591 [Physcomitrium patens]XP_024358297.1 uncharacterized protein LOC112273591 [Physcomitrium patens]PNR33523.1 hypothetical protein PHYPA_025467 [Physcomitrium patens]|eukprot:XP_024358296.1 uncharacterized protein LOC112273591 [Physcomitrella patens]